MLRCVYLWYCGCIYEYNDMEILNGWDVIKLWLVVHRFVDNLRFSNTGKTLLKIRWSWYEFGKIQKKKNYNVFPPFYGWCVGLQNEDVKF